MLYFLLRIPLYEAEERDEKKETITGTYNQG